MQNVALFLHSPKHENVKSLTPKSTPPPPVQSVNAHTHPCLPSTKLHCLLKNPGTFSHKIHRAEKLTAEWWMKQPFKIKVFQKLQATESECKILPLKKNPL